MRNQTKMANLDKYARGSIAVAALIASVALAAHGKTDIARTPPGGAATAKLEVFDRASFAQPSGNLNEEQQFRFSIGNAAFRKRFVPAPADTKANDGLGPLFNATSCESCHQRDGRGRPPAPAAKVATSYTLHLLGPQGADGQPTPDPVYGKQLQDAAIPGHYPEGHISVTYSFRFVRLADGETVELRKPHVSLSNLRHGSLASKTRLSPRIAQQMIGLGLLENIPETQILAWSDPTDKDGDGISGRAHFIPSAHSPQRRLGRFGHRASVATLREQIALALITDMGLSTTLHREASGDCTQHQPDCLSAPNGNTPRDNDAEVSTALLELLTFYSQNVAVPPRRRPNAPEVLAGETIFSDIGCASCHRPQLKTSEKTGPQHLRSQTIHPFTDLLLHDMGPGLADPGSAHSESAREWRTAPLWGIGLTQLVNGHTLFLHDGRARNLTEAILWHGGEAQAARERFRKLQKRDRDNLIAYIRSL